MALHKELPENEARLVIEAKLQKTPLTADEMKLLLKGGSTMRAVSKRPIETNWQIRPANASRTASILNEVDDPNSGVESMGLLMGDTYLAIDFDCSYVWPSFYPSLLPETLQIIGKRSRTQLIYKICPQEDTRWVFLAGQKKRRHGDGMIEFRHGVHQSIVYGAHPTAGNYLAYNDGVEGEITTLSFDVFQSFLLSLGLTQKTIDRCIDGDIAAKADKKEMRKLDPVAAMKMDRSFSQEDYDNLVAYATHLRNHYPDFDMTVDAVSYLKKSNRKLLETGELQGNRNNSWYKLAMDYHGLVFMFESAGFEVEHSLWDIMLLYGSRCEPPLQPEEPELAGVYDRLISGQEQHRRKMGASKPLDAIVKHLREQVLVPRFYRYMKERGEKAKLTTYTEQGKVEVQELSIVELLDKIDETVTIEKTIERDARYQSFVDFFAAQRSSKIQDNLRFLPESVREKAQAVYGEKYHGWVHALMGAFSTGLYPLLPCFEVMDTYEEARVSYNAPWVMLIAPTGVGKSDFTRRLFTMYKDTVKKTICGDQKLQTRKIKNLIYDPTKSSLSMRQAWPEADDPEMQKQKAARMVELFGHPMLANIMKYEEELFMLGGDFTYEALMARASADRLRFTIKRKTAKDELLCDEMLYRRVYQHPVLVVHDELARIFRFGQYKIVSTDRELLLELKMRGTLDRYLKSGAERVDNLALALFGGIQPGVLAKELTSQNVDSGLLHRMGYLPLAQNTAFKRDPERFLSVDKAYRKDRFNKPVLTTEQDLQLDFAVAGTIAYRIALVNDVQHEDGSTGWVPTRYILCREASMDVDRFVGRMRRKYTKTASRDNDPLEGYYSKIPDELLTHAALYKIQHYIMDLVPQVREALNMSAYELAQALRSGDEEILIKIDKALSLVSPEQLDYTVDMEAYEYACAFIEQSLMTYSRLLNNRHADADNRMFVRNFADRKTRLEVDENYRLQNFEQEVLESYIDLLRQQPGKGMSIKRFINRRERQAMGWRDLGRMDDEATLTVKQLTERVQVVMDNYSRNDRATCMVASHQNRQGSMQYVLVEDSGSPVLFEEEEEDETLVVEPETAVMPVVEPLTPVIDPLVEKDTELLDVNPVNPEVLATPGFFVGALLNLPTGEDDGSDDDDDDGSDDDGGSIVDRTPVRPDDDPDGSGGVELDTSAEAELEPVEVAAATEVETGTSMSLSALDIDAEIEAQVFAAPVPEAPLTSFNMSDGFDEDDEIFLENDEQEEDDGRDLPNFDKLAPHEMFGEALRKRVEAFEPQCIFDPNEKLELLPMTDEIAEKARIARETLPDKLTEDQKDMLNRPAAYCTDMLVSSRLAYQHKRVQPGDEKAYWEEQALHYGVDTAEEALQIRTDEHIEEVKAMAIRHLGLDDIFDGFTPEKRDAYWQMFYSRRDTWANIPDDEEG